MRVIGGDPDEKKSLEGRRLLVEREDGGGKGKKKRVEVEEM